LFVVFQTPACGTDMKKAHPQGMSFVMIYNPYLHMHIDLTPSESGYDDDGYG
jgi:hypothetical protein